MKTFTPEQLQKIRTKLKPHLADKSPGDAVDHPFYTLQDLLEPSVLATKAGIQRLSNVLYRCCGITITLAVA